MKPYDGDEVGQDEPDEELTPAEVKATERFLEGMRAGEAQRATDRVRARVKRKLEDLTSPRRKPAVSRKAALTAAAAVLLVGLLGVNTVWGLRAARELKAIGARQTALGEGLGAFRTTYRTVVAYQLDEDALRQLQTARSLQQKGQIADVACWWQQSSTAMEAVPPDGLAGWSAALAWRWGAEFFMQRNYTLAEKLFLRAQGLGLDMPELDMAMANLAKEQGNWSEASKRLTVMLAKPFPSSARACAANLLAYCLYRSAQGAGGDERARLLAEAEEAVAQALQLAGDEGYAKAYVQSGLICSLEGQADAARDAFRRAGEVAADKLATYTNSPRLLWTQAIAAARAAQMSGGSEAEALRLEALRAFREAVANETADFPVSWWAPTEAAFTESGLTARREFREAMGLRRAREEPIPVSITGMLWDEPFQVRETGAVFPVPTARAQDGSASGHSDGRDPS